MYKLRIIILNFILACVVLLFIHLKVSSDNADAWMGTGWFINNQGYLVTAGHVVDRAKYLLINYKGSTYRAFVVARDKDHDIAIIKAIIFDPHIIPISLNKDDNQEVIVLGFPQPEFFGYNLHYSIGTVTFGAEFNNYVYIHAKTCPGNSGSPVINTQGNSVGILTLGYLIYMTDLDTKCTTEGRAESIKALVDLANTYHVPITVGNMTINKTLAYWSYYYKDSVVLIYGST